MVKYYSTPTYSMSAVRSYNRTTQPRKKVKCSPGASGGSSFLSPPGFRGSVRAPVSLKRKIGSLTKNTSSIKHGKVLNEGTGGQCSYFSLPRGKSYLPKHVENALPPRVFQGNVGLQLKSGVGFQNAGAMISALVPGDVTALTGDKMSRALLHKFTGDVTMNNIMLSNCYIIIYDIVARKDIALSAVRNPLVTWSQGGSDEGTATAYTYLGSTPWQSEAFNQYYDVKQVTNIVLAAGGTHVHKTRLEPNRLISSSYATYTPYGFKDLSYFCVVEVHGAPANDTVTQTQVSIGAAALNIIVDVETTLKQIQNQTPTITTNNTLVFPFTVAEQVLNLGGSTVVPNAEG